MTKQTRSNLPGGLHNGEIPVLMVRAAVPVHQTITEPAWPAL